MSSLDRLPEQSAGPSLEVWAPFAERVEVVTKEQRFALTARSGGWFSLEDATLAPGVDYSFSLDGSGDVPDPRSGWQPRGIHGPSRIVDHHSFRWTDGDWPGIPIDEKVIYEMHVGTFTPGGTFDSAIERLGYLTDLGVGAIELMPVAEFPGQHGWGYDGVDLYAPHHAYGGPEGLKRLVDACHACGLGVVMDVVYNHLGPSGNYLGRFGPYFTDRYSTPWGQAVNLDGPDSDPVRRFFLDNALMWLRDYHCDGLRLDAIHAIIDNSAVHLLEELHDEVRELEALIGRPLFLIAESDLNDPRVIRSIERGGYGMDAQWSDDFHHALHAVLTGETGGYYGDFGKVEDIATALQQGFVYAGRHSDFRGRHHGRDASDLPGHRFVGYIQTHDQVGNRALGERIGHIAGVAKAKLAAALVLTGPFLPMIFQGEEWAASSPFQYFTDHEDPELAAAVSKGRTQEFAAFGWDPSEVPDPQDPGTFDRSRLRWDELGRGEHSEVLAWHKALVQLRAAEPDLRADRLQDVRVSFDETERWLMVERGRFVVACNLGESTASIGLARGEDPSPVLTSGAVMFSATGVTLGPAAVVIFRRGR